MRHAFFFYRTILKRISPTENGSHWSVVVAIRRKAQRFVIPNLRLEIKSLAAERQEVWSDRNPKLNRFELDARAGVVSNYVTCRHFFKS